MNSPTLNAEEEENDAQGYVRKTPDLNSLKKIPSGSSSSSAAVTSMPDIAGELVEDDVVKTEEVSAEIEAAQQLAEAEVAQLESEKAAEEPENSVVIIPRLLQGAPDVNQLVAKTQEFKAKGQQLDLLLLKAETYSHFIRENQERSKKKLEEGSHFSVQDEEEDQDKKADTSSKKRKTRSPAGKKKASKITKGSKGNPVSVPPPPQLPSSTDQDPNDTFRVTKSLVGGTLMSYQKEGLKWLLSLWENGLSGILADEM